MAWWKINHRDWIFFFVFFKHFLDQFSLYRWRYISLFCSASTIVTLEFRSQYMRPSGIAVSHPERICVFLISFYRWWTCIIFIIRPTSCLERRVNNFWVNLWRKSSKPFCKRLKVTCELFSVSFDVHLFDIGIIVNLIKLDQSFEQSFYVISFDIRHKKGTQFFWITNMLCVGK